MTPDEAFERDIPPDQQEMVMTEICEAAIDGRGQHGRVYITNVDHMDVINLCASGSIEIDGTEFWFIVENGNWNGTVLRGWEEAGQQKFEHHTPTQWALVPRNDLVGDAIALGRGPFLVAKWDAMLARADVASIPSKYAYDRHFQPGGKVERHWKDAAAKYGFVLTDQEQANEVRARLMAATGSVEG